MKELEKPISYIRKRLEPYLNTIDEYINSESQQKYYKIIKKKKRRGGYRYIYQCSNVDLRTTHKVLYELLREYQDSINDAAHGFVKHKSTFTNAQPHTQKRYIVHVDIKDFFDNIFIGQVESSLIRLGIHENVAKFISTLATVDGVMRQGLHTSPDLSNHCLYNVDNQLVEYALVSDFAYTRYGDDITISGESKPDVEVIKKIIASEGFGLNEEKIKVQRRGSSQYVTGLTVFDSQPRIPKQFKKRLRLQLYYINKFGFEEHVKRTRSINHEDFESEEDYRHYLEGALFGSAKYLVGHVAYVNSVENDRANDMWSILNDNKIRDYFYTSPDLLYPADFRISLKKKA